MKDLSHSGDGTELPSVDLWYEMDISVLDMLNFRYLSTFERRRCQISCLVCESRIQLTGLQSR